MRRALALSVLALLLVGGTLAVAAPASAGDNLALYVPEPDETAVEPGDTVEVPVTVVTDGGYVGGVTDLELDVAIHPEVGEIEDVETGPFLGGDGGDVEENVTRIEDGVVRIEQERVGTDDGQTTADEAEPVAVLTVAIADDAPPSDAVLDVDWGRTLVVGDDRIRSTTREATLEVAGGGDVYEHPSTTDDEDDDVGVTRGEDRVDEDESTGDDESADEDDAVPGFTVGVAVVGALLAAGGALLAHGRRFDARP